MYQIRKKQETGEEEEYKEDELPPQWVPDHSCQAVGSHCLFDQYLEIGKAMFICFIKKSRSVFGVSEISTVECVA